jgi:hypothetical protein
LPAATSNRNCEPPFRRLESRLWTSLVPLPCMEYSLNSARLVICWDISISGLFGTGGFPALVAKCHKPRLATRPDPYLSLVMFGP